MPTPSTLLRSIEDLLAYISVEDQQQLNLCAFALAATNVDAVNEM
jgi:hypothetical protein